jgi:hypothetical protein
MLCQRNDARPAMPIAGRALQIPKRNRIDASGSRRFTGKSRSTTVPQLSQAIINQRCFDVRAAAIFGQNHT